MAPDGIGFIQLLNVFGDDLTVVNAARVSFAKETEEMRPMDERLIKYLAEHDHVSPFFHPQLRFRVKMPIFVAREWYRHQIGFARNEVSRRYVDTKPECWVPSQTDMRARDPNLKQGSRSEAIDDAEACHGHIVEFHRVALELYNTLLLNRVAPEVARCILPQSMYTEFIETGSLAAYARLCGLRLSPAAQKEIRGYAAGLSTLVEPRFPVSWSSLQKQEQEQEKPPQ